jgi:hypothetical protein
MAGISKVALRDPAIRLVILRLTAARLGFAAGALRVWVGAALGVACGRAEIGGLVILFFVEDFVFITANARAVLMLPGSRKQN